MEEPVGKPHDEASALHVGISAIQTKTWLDYQAGGSPLKVYWSDGDKINVNGISSLSLSVEEGAKMPVADFNIYGVEAPFNVIYPATIVSGTTYDSEGYINVALPSSQAYHPTTFASGAAIMCGYSDNSNVTLSNLCSAVRVNVKGTETIVSASVISASESAPLCGDFKINPQTGVLAPVGGSAKLTLDLTENIALNENGVDFFFTLPAGDYSDGLSFYFEREDGRNLECIWKPEDALKPGKLYSFNDVDYVPGAKDITTAEDWEEFAAAVNEGNDEALKTYLYKGGFVRLGADFTAENLSQVTSDFTYVFDGNGHSITQSAANTSLFASVSGEIKNLSLAGSLDLGDKSGSPLVYTLKHGGKISSCINNMSVEASTQSETYVSGLVTVMQGGTIESCINNGTVDVTVDVDDDIYYVGVAGIVADIQADQEDRSILLKNCKNSSDGALTLSPYLNFTSTSKTNNKGMKSCALAGIAGFIRNSATYTFDNCDNEGPVTISAALIRDANGNSPRPVSVGGILGLAAPIDDETGLLVDPKDYEQDGFAISMSNCDNRGLIYNCGVTYSSTKESRNKMYTGGIVGSISGRDGQYANITSCTSLGDIITYDIIANTPNYVVSGRPAYCAVAGGLVGFGGYLNIDGCSVDCQIGNGRRPMVAWGGVIGYTVRPFILNNTSLNLSGYYQRLEGYKMNRAVVAVVPVKHNTTAMDLVPDVSGSKITGNLSVIGYLLTSGSTLGSSDSGADLTSTLTTKVFASLDKVKENLVCGQGFTTNAGVDYSSATITHSAQ